MAATLLLLGALVFLLESDSWFSGAIGVGFLTPRIKQLNALIQERGERDAAVQAAVQPILLAARIDIALLLLIVIDMTLKPSF